MNAPVGRMAIALALVSMASAPLAEAQSTSGPVIAWGLNNLGQCNVPEPNSGFVSVALGEYHSLALRADGSIVVWGDTRWELDRVPDPNSGFVAVSESYGHVLALRSDGSIEAWGLPDDGRTTVPAPNSDFVAIAAGNNHSLGLKSDGHIVAWGLNEFGVCDVPEPNSDFVSVSAGASHSLALKSSGSIVAWGYNVYGQCDVPEPNSEYVKIEAGGYHNLGLKADGTIVAWGQDLLGECAVPEPNADFVDISAGLRLSAGIKAGGSAVVWGAANYGQCTVPDPDAFYHAIEVGESHVLGIVCDEPIPVFLSHVIVQRIAGGCLVAWCVNDMAGIRHAIEVWRQEADAVRVRLAVVDACGLFGCSFLDEAPPSGAADYWLRDASSGDWFGPARLQATAPPLLLRLYPNQPNPFNPMTTIRFDVPVGGRVRLEVYDVAGRLVRTLLDAELPAGSHQAVWDGRDEAGRAMASGSYFARLSGAGGVATVRMGLVR